MPAITDKKTPANWNAVLEARDANLGVSQQIKKETKSAALGYAVKHNLTMAETFEQAIALLIGSDLTPPSDTLDMSKIPSDAHGVSEVTLKFTKLEMDALKQRLGILGLESKLETLLANHEVEGV
jgi:hypothetical protein